MSRLRQKYVKGWRLGSQAIALLMNEIIRVLGFHLETRFPDEPSNHCSAVGIRVLTLTGTGV
ncbi:MAG: hypothetical protein HWQ38_01020 [Nostoc sp. NMS7]|uniref:hypothetical protein n=1 Tax=Nostoc sp. NMS7 TaxID=2815391 RepID=UPI0025E9C576|nr:hypothetical protein [Nostoc sp. NMS7]MBN3945136.1 hypothetical protein [Nostoc sp. NMS7]